MTLTGSFTVAFGTFDANGQDMTVAGNWSNSGTLGVGTTGVLNLDGSFTGVGVGTVNRTNGTINVTGTT